MPAILRGPVTAAVPRGVLLANRIARPSRHVGEDAPISGVRLTDPPAGAWILQQVHHIKATPPADRTVSPLPSPGHDSCQRKQLSISSGCFTTVLGEIKRMTGVEWATRRPLLYFVLPLSLGARLAD